MNTIQPRAGGGQEFVRLPWSSKVGSPHSASLCIAPSGWIMGMIIGNEVVLTIDGSVAVSVKPKLFSAARFALTVHERPVQESKTALPAPGPVTYGSTEQSRAPDAVVPSTSCVMGSA